MEENKYYTPEINEFHVGFEYEWRWKPSAKSPKEDAKDSDFVSSIDFIQYGGRAPEEVIEDRERKYQDSITWKKVVLTEEIVEWDRDGGEVFNPFSPSFNVEFRVKYLSKEDIEAEGFKFLMENEKRYVFRKPIDYQGRGVKTIAELLYNPANHWCLIYIGDEETMVGDFDTIFAGVIRNKSEFRKTLKIIGI